MRQTTGRRGDRTLPVETVGNDQDTRQAHGRHACLMHRCPQRRKNVKERWRQQICLHLLVYYLLTEIGLSDIIIMHEIRSIAGFGNGACFQNIGTVGNGKGHLCILFHQ